jgi:MoaA/NifB/PqqE/SkfB family radical SAM enzyme
MKPQLTNENVKNELTREPSTNNLRVIQIHPTLQCNLTCRHCYSSSEPSLKKSISPEHIVHFLQYARTYGFEVLSVSGGEPFLYPHLEELLIKSHSLGNKNIAVSNGMLLKAEKAKRALRHLDVLAISIDGEEAFHDNMRNLQGAFRKMNEGVKVLRENEINFGFIHTVTEHSWEILLWLADFAYTNGALLLQLHPLELTGRATINFNHLTPSQKVLHKIFIIGNYLETKYEGRMKIQMDFLHRQNILQLPGCVHFFGENFHLNETNFSDVVKCLVVNEAGNIYPMSYGFSDYFCIGHISDIEKGKDIIKDFIDAKGGQLYDVVSKTYEQIKNNEEDDLAIWTAMIVKQSHLFEHHKRH